MMTETNQKEKLLEEIALMPEPQELLAKAKELLDADYENKGGDNYFTPNFNGKGSDRYMWEDGGGQEVNIIFKADGKNEDSILAYAYDHESVFNVYSQDKPILAFEEIPESMKHLLEGEELKWEWDDMENPKRVHATVAIWREPGDTSWHIGEKFLEAVEKEKDTGGFKYGFQSFFVKK